MIILTITLQKCLGSMLATGPQHNGREREKGEGYSSHNDMWLSTTLPDHIHRSTLGSLPNKLMANPEK